MTKMLRILVVDDDVNMRRTLADILALAGYQVVTCTSPVEGLLELESAPFDCVVSDIRMPGMNGVQFYQAIRAKDADLPVLLMTAYADQELLFLARALGLRFFLEKPLELERLFAWLAEVSACRSGPTLNAE